MEPTKNQLRRARRKCHKAAEADFLHSPDFKHFVFAEVKSDMEKAEKSA
jgi:hypothetical protein